MAEDYFSFCEKLWRGWRDHNLSVPPLSASRFVRKTFDLNAAPEPYIDFSAGAKPLVALTTNPGATMSHQRRAAVRPDSDQLCEKDNYTEAARKLGEFYQRKLAGRPAGHRIAKLRMLSCCSGYEGVLQVEACPFHSPSLRNKSALLQEIDKDDLLGCYVGHLRTFLQDRPVLSPQAAPTRDSLGPEAPKSYPWLKWIARTAGLDLNNAEFVTLAKKGSKTTAAAWVSKGRVLKALVLMMGMTGLPANEGLWKLAGMLRRS
jgi:hypothetical protein